MTAAFELARNGVTVEVCERNAEPFRGASWYAGGMLAPWCERENAEEPVLTLGQAALDWWDETTPGLVARHGTLVVAPARDKAELSHFASRTGGYRWVDEERSPLWSLILPGGFAPGFIFRARGISIRALH